MTQSPLRYNAEELPQPRRKEAWNGALAELCGGPFYTEFSDAALVASIERRPLLDLHLVLMRQNLVAAGRTSREIARGIEGRYSLILQLEGRCGILQQDRSTLLRPGQMALVDGRRPFALHYDGLNEHLFVRIPPELVDRSFERSVVPLATAITSGAAVVTGALLRSAYDHVLTCGHAEQAALRDALLGLCLSTSTGQGAPQPAHQSASLQRVNQYIEAHAHDPALSPGEVAEACSISVRQLHRLLAATGETMSSRLRRIRLNRCAADLRDPHLWSDSVTEIAFRRGFNDSAHFSRLFKAAFGQSPRRFRLAARAA
jgi:AraC-like DNA-binding protein